MGNKNGGAAGAEETELEQENLDGLENEPNPQNNDLEPQPGEGKDPDGGGEGDGLGDDLEGHESEPRQKEGEEPEELDPRDAKIAELTAAIEEIKKGQKPPEEKQPVAKEPTSEEKEAFREANGVSWEYNQSLLGAMGKIVEMLTGKLDERFAEASQSSLIDSFAKKPGFEDAGVYSKGINEFLGNFPATKRSDPKVLEAAYYHAVGRAAKGGRKNMNSNEKNKRVLNGTKTLPVKQGGATGKGDKGFASYKFTPQQRSAAKAAGMSLEEYYGLMQQRPGSAKR